MDETGPEIGITLDACLVHETKSGARLHNNNATTLNAAMSLSLRFMVHTSLEHNIEPHWATNLLLGQHE